MAEFSVDETMAATEGVLRQQGNCQQFTGISTDTRTIVAGNLFVALVGEKFDGHNFISQAVEKGAAGVLVSKEVQVPEKVAVFKVENTLAGLQQLAAFHRRRFSIPVIAITGSNGKTTTKDMTAAVLSSRFSILKTQANYNNEIGLSLTLLGLMPEHQAAVVEMGMRGRGEIGQLAHIAKPTIAAVTNVGETHLELLGSIENIAAAKAELVEAIEPDGLIILNKDNDYVYGMRHKAKGSVIFYGIQSDADVKASDIVSSETGVSFTCACKEGTFSLFLPVPGKHNVYNALAAVAVGITLGLTKDEIVSGLESLTLSGMRLSVSRVDQYTVINDAYNASPMSMQAALEALRDVAARRKIAVLGDMLELGDIAVEAHRNIGKLIVKEKIDVLVTLGKLAGHIAAAAIEYGAPEVIACDSHEAAKAALKRTLEEGDTILIKGSRGMRMEKILEMFTQPSV